MRVSVVIPCHDAEPYLAQAIGSALDQQHPAHEVVVVDDGSTDGSLEVALRFAAAYPGRVRVCSTPNRRAARARNTGSMLAAGEALLFLDADDVLSPDALDALVTALRDAPGGVALCPWYRMEDHEGRWVQRPPSCVPLLPGDDALAGWLTGWYHPTSSVLWSRAAFERAGRFDEECLANQDGDVMMRALAAGVPVATADRGAGYYRRVAGGSISAARFDHDAVWWRLRVLEKVQAALEEHGRSRAYAAPLHEAATTLATDLCADHPDLRARALALADAAGAGRIARSTRRARRRFHGRTVFIRDLPARVARRLARTGENTAVPDDVEVIAGRDVAQAAMHIEPDRDADLTGGLVAPAVSVVIPAYQRAHVIGRAIDSVLAQTFGDLEVIVADDGSRDGTDEVVRAYRDPRVRYHPRAGNAGVSAARNRGMRLARGEFIALLDSDDEWFPDKLASQVALLRDRPATVGLVYGGLENHDGERVRDVFVPEHRGDLHRTLLAENVLHGAASTVLLRRSVVATVGFFDEGIPAIEDYDYWVRIARFFDIDYVPGPVGRYHDPSGVQDRKSLNVRENLDAREWFYRKHRGQMQRASVAHRFLLKSVRRHLADDDDAGARTLALRAIGHAPTTVTPYRRLLGTFAPDWVKRLVHARDDGQVHDRRPT